MTDFNLIREQDTQGRIVVYYHRSVIMGHV